MRRRWPGLVGAAAAVAGSLAVAAAVIAITGGDPLGAFTAMVYGAFGDQNGVLRTLAKATPLLFTGLAVAVGLRAGVFNIGAEGQLVVGALASAWVGYAVPGLPTFVHLPLALMAGVLAGAAWAFVPGLLKAWRGTHEVIVTIMMNYIAFEATHYLVNGPLRDPHTGAVATPPILPTARLLALSDLTHTHHGTNFSVGFLMALAAAAGYGFLMRRTALGYELRAVGLGRDAARAAGIPVGRIVVTAMVLSGALAGLAGSVEVLGVHRRFFDMFSPGYGFDSIAVALLGALNSLGITLSAILFGALNSGAIAMESATNTPRQIAGIIQAVVILAAAARYLHQRTHAE
ncbi:MAG: ABC transporter permease [Chthonomonadales bacterium]